MKETKRMIKRNMIRHFCEGFSSVFTFGEFMPQSYKYPLTDAQAMAHDWCAVGDYLNKAMNHTRNR